MSKNVTLRMDEELLKAFRHKAVDAGLSLSAWIVETLKESLEDETDAVRERAMSRLMQGYSLKGEPLSRDDVYAR
ncbi:MAG: hypothetical protein PQJ59_02160 [Spirochaetales bacterium]|nr:hypothetical protein [Spirochaetales bacterium]